MAQHEGRPSPNTTVSLEAVARAICAAEGGNPDALVMDNFRGAKDESYLVPAWRYHEAEARAVIALFKTQPPSRSSSAPPSQGSATPVPLAEALEKKAEEAERLHAAYDATGDCCLTAACWAQAETYRDAARMAREAEASIPTSQDVLETLVCARSQLATLGGDLPFEAYDDQVQAAVMAKIDALLARLRPIPTPHPAPVARPAGEEIEIDPTAEREAQEKHAEWMKRMAGELPALASRVFALRGTGYMGSRFGWAMERRLGRAIAHVNDFEGDIWHGRKGFAARVVAKLAVEELYRDVADAEQSATLSRAPASPSGSGEAELRASLEGLYDLCTVGASADAFRNGVTDSTGTIDEGDARASELLDRARMVLASAPTADTSGRGSGTGGEA